ncbi:MAG TPA: hypothetical protein VGK74_26545 [Symbiobacteriaceae bacterium]
MELEKLTAQTEAAIRERLDLPRFDAGKVSVWIKFVRHVRSDGSLMEEPVGPVQKMVLYIASYDDLVRTVAENMILTVYGSDLQIVPHLPNLIVKLFDRKVFVPVAGAPPLDQPDQIFLKATVYRYEPSLWDQLFKRKAAQTD